jgi:hypothetical protein
VYGTERDWGSYDKTKPIEAGGRHQGGALRQGAYGVITLDVDGRHWT